MDARGERVFDRRGQRILGDLAKGAIRSRRPGQRARLGQRPHALLDEERVALRPVQELSSERARFGAGSQQVREQGLGGVGRQAIHAQLRVERLTPPAVTILGSIGDHEQDVSGRHRVHELIERHLGIGVDPVQVLEGNDDGAGLALTNEQIPQRVEHPPGSLRGTRLCPDRVVDGDVEQAGQGAQQRRVQLERLQANGQPLDDLAGAVVRTDGEEGTQERGRGASPRGALGGGHGRVQDERFDRVARLDELQQQTRFPGAGLSDQRHDLTPSPARELPPRVQQVQLRLAVDEPREAPPRPQPGRVAPHDRERRGHRRVGAVLAPQLEMAFDERRRLGADVHAPGLGAGQQPVEQMRERGPLGFVDQHAIGDLADRRLLRVNDRGHPQTGPRRLRDGAVDGQRGADRPARGAVDGGDAEGRVEGRLPERLHATAEPDDLLGGQAQEQRGVARRVGGAGQRDPQQRHVPALPLGRREGRRPGRHDDGRKLLRALGRRRVGLFPRAQTVTHHARTDRVPRDPELRGGPHDVPAGGVEGGQELLTLAAGRGGQARRGAVAAAGHRDVGGGHVAAVDEEGQALHHVGQLAHVAGPGVARHDRLGVGSERLDGQPVFTTRPLEEPLAQQDRVAATLPQRRKAHGHHRQPVIQVLAELPLAHGPVEIGVGRADHPGIEGLLRGAADAPHRSLFERGQQLGLERGREQPDLVEEQDPSGGRLEQAGLRATGVGEGALLVTEELALQQGLGDGRTVEIHERPLGAGPVAVEQLRHQVLARSRLALDEDGRQPPTFAREGQQPREIGADRFDGRTVPGELSKKIGHVAR